MFFMPIISNWKLFKCWKTKPVTTNLMEGGEEESKEQVAQNNLKVEDYSNQNEETAIRQTQQSAQ